MVSEFTDEVYTDIESMSTEFGSSWNFQQYLQFHIRYIRATNSNMIRYGSRPRYTAFFNKKASLLFKGQVYDPTFFAFGKSLCVPIAICVSLFLKFKYSQLRSIPFPEMKLAINALNFAEVYSPDPTDGGISPHSFRQLERLNTPFPEALLTIFPRLQPFQGLAINLFRVQLASDEKPTAFLFPSLLSLHNTKPTHVQIDLLRDSPSIRPDTIIPTRNHVLTIRNLPSLIANRCPSYDHTNSRRYQFACRSCLRVFLSPAFERQHRIHCHVFPTGGKCIPRRSRNIRHHKEFTTDYYTGLQVPRGLQFEKGSLYRLGKALVSGFYDCEAITRTFSPENRPGNAPPSAVSDQVIFSFSYSFVSLYKSIPLPLNLR